MPPLYDYKCDEGHTFEIEHSITAEPLTQCTVDKCEARCYRLISHSNFILKGSGWTPKGSA